MWVALGVVVAPTVVEELAVVVVIENQFVMFQTLDPLKGTGEALIHKA